MPGRDYSAELFGDSQPAAKGGRDLSALIRGDAPAEPLSRMEKFGHGMMDMVNGGAQLLTNALPDDLVKAGNKANNWLADKTGLVARLPEGGVDQQVREGEAAYQGRRTASGESGLDGYRALGNIANPLNLALAARIPQVASLAGRVGIGAAAGGLNGALTPVGEGDFATEKAKQVGLGAAIGGAVPAVGAGMARVISPNATRSPHLALLQAEGVQPTVGQTLGGRWNALEEKLTSLPIMGDAIASARKRSLDQFNKAAINRASGEVGAQVDEVGQAGVKQAGDAISHAYESALNKISGVRLDPQFNTELMQLRGMAQGLTTTMKAKFNNAVNETLLRKVSPNGSILPHDYKAIDSELGNLAGRYGKSSVASEQELGDAVTQLQALIKQQMMRSNPHVADELKAADTAWANLVRVEGAAKSGKNAEGVFTPAQLNMAIQGADQSVRKRSVARGTALMQDLGNAGQAVLGNKVPNSGTPERLMYGAGALGTYFINPAIPGALIGGAAAYTPPVQAALRAAILARPASAQPIAEGFRKAAPALIPAASQLGLGLLDY